MRLSDKELSKIETRRKMWSLFGWWWPFRKTKEWMKYDSIVGDECDYVKEMRESKGIGFFRNNHSLNCGCGMCRGETARKKHERKQNRKKNKIEVMDYRKEYNTFGEID